MGSADLTPGEAEDLAGAGDLKLVHMFKEQHRGLCRNMGINSATATGPWRHPDFPHELEASHPELVSVELPAANPLSDITLLRLKNTIPARDARRAVRRAREAHGKRGSGDGFGGPDVVSRLVDAFAERVGTPKKSQWARSSSTSPLVGRPLPDGVHQSLWILPPPPLWAWLS